MPRPQSHPFGSGVQGFNWVFCQVYSTVFWCHHQFKRKMTQNLCPSIFLVKHKKKTRQSTPSILSPSHGKLFFFCRLAARSSRVSYQAQINFGLNGFFHPCLFLIAKWFPTFLPLFYDFLPNGFRQNKRVVLLVVVSLSFPLRSWAASAECHPSRSL